MGREFASAVARWCHLLDDGPIPILTGICDTQYKTWQWFKDNFPTIKIVTDNYNDLLASKDVEAIYCAVPHNLHEKIYIDIIRAHKHLLGEKPFGIDKRANAHILNEVVAHPEVIVRCSSEFPYFPGAKRVIEWCYKKKYGRLIEIKSGFYHSSDMDLNKPINWKRMVETNGEYGCLGDLGLHTQHIPFRLGWVPKKIYADLLKIAETRPDGKGNIVPCQTWDNAILNCKCIDPDNKKEFSLILETKRMAPGHTNTWFIEVYGTQGAIKFSTHEPKTVYTFTFENKEQGWTSIDLGSQSFIPSITGSIFEFGFADAFQQMIGAFMQEFREKGSTHPFKNVTPEETALSHKLMTFALESYKTGRCLDIPEI